MQLYACKRFTPLEITASEEFYWEHYGGLEKKLENRQQPLTKKTFLRYKNPSTFRGKVVKFPSDSWTPKE